MIFLAGGAIVIRKLTKIISAVTLSCMAAGMLGGCGNTVKKPDEKKTIDLSEMKLVYEENFDSELDRSVWTTSHRTNIRRGGYWDEDQCFIKDGCLIIRTEYKKDGKYGDGWYSGTCSTRGLKEFKYGYFEVRCKAPAAQGLWSAFWMQSEGMTDGSDDPSGKKGAEIDVMESPYYNDPSCRADKYRNTTMNTVHTGGYGDSHESKTSGFVEVDKDMYSEFNTYGVLWTQDEYIFYINGKESWRTDFGVSQSPEFLWLSVEIAGETDSANPDNENNKFTWSGDIRDNPDEMMPADFVVDYVKVYQAKE